MTLPPFHDRDGVIWYNGTFVPWRGATLHVLSHGLHYASSVFEGERAYNGKIFKSREHAQRLHDSARALDFTLPWSIDEIDSAKHETLRQNNLTNAYIRPVAWRGSENMGISAKENQINLAIAVWEWPSYFPPELRAQGIRLTMADYRRPSPDTIPSSAKAAGLYMICTVSKHRAERAGYADALMLDWRGHVAECTGANIFFVKDGILHTPTADCFLNGITRQTVIELARKHGLTVIERTILPTELSDFSECFITGTASEITPVGSIMGHAFTPGVLTHQLIEAYAACTQGASS